MWKLGQFFQSATNYFGPFKRQNPVQRRKKDRRLQFERVEDRRLLTTLTWAGGNGIWDSLTGNWHTSNGQPAIWEPGAVAKFDSPRSGRPASRSRATWRSRASSSRPARGTSIQPGTRGATLALPEFRAKQHQGR